MKKLWIRFRRWLVSRYKLSLKLNHIIEVEEKSENISDGGSNSFYIFPKWVCDVDSLNRYLKSNSAEGNILKSLTSNIGVRHDGTNKKREVKKCLHYSVENMLWEGFNEEDILIQVKKQLEDKR